MALIEVDVEEQAWCECPLLHFGDPCPDLVLEWVVHVDFQTLSPLPLAARAPDRRPSTPQPKQFISFPSLTASAANDVRLRLQRVFRQPRRKAPPVLD
jgi:hypothetical protein